MEAQDISLKRKLAFLSIQIRPCRKLPMSQDPSEQFFEITICTSDVNCLGAPKTCGRLGLSYPLEFK